MVLGPGMVVGGSEVVIGGSSWICVIVGGSGVVLCGCRWF